MARRYHEEMEMEKSECKSVFIFGDSELPLNGGINFISYRWNLLVNTETGISKKVGASFRRTLSYRINHQNVAKI